MLKNDESKQINYICLTCEKPFEIDEAMQSFNRNFKQVRCPNCGSPSVVRMDDEK